MARILVVGTATLDLVFELDHHPDSDEEMRAGALRTCRGGNAANTAVVLRQLGHEVEFLGVLADAAESAVIEQDFAAHDVAFSRCPRLPGRPPTSSIYLSGAHRSIVHYRDLSELAPGHFKTIDPRRYDLIHFECRNVAVIEHAIRIFRQQAPATRISVEFEKPREGMASLYSLVDIAICSRGFALHHGHHSAAEFIRWMRPLAPQATLVVAWGEQGAYGEDEAGKQYHAPAQHLEQIVDTLGAGDTFNAGLISALIGREPLSRALTIACELAGRKCSVHGFDFAVLLQKNDTPSK